MDITQALQGLQQMQAMLPQLQEALKTRAVQEVVAGGGAVIVRPEWFPRPARAAKGVPGNVDPWFNLTQADWTAEMEAGFTGWIKTTEDSVRGKVMINYEAAREWLADKLRRQQARREAGPAVAE